MVPPNRKTFRTIQDLGFTFCSFWPIGVGMELTPAISQSWSTIKNLLFSLAISLNDGSCLDFLLVSAILLLAFDPNQLGFGSKIPTKVVDFLGVRFLITTIALIE